MLGVPRGVYRPAVLSPGAWDRPSQREAKKMAAPLRVVVAEYHTEMREYLRRMVTQLGHEVVASAAGGKDLVERCRNLRPDLVITAIEMPDLDGLEAVAAICRAEPVPVIVISAEHHSEVIERAAARHVLAYLLKPIESGCMAAAIAIVLRRFEEFQALRREATDLRQALDDRKHIEKAKGLLMKKAQVPEDEAFRRLQKMARDHNKKLGEMARLFLRASKALEPDRCQEEEERGPGGDRAE
jgi:AmiR/NasT family two-component response regulator